MACYDTKDPGSIKVKFPDYLKNLGKSIKGLRIGIPGYFLQGLDPDVEQTFRKTTRKLDELEAEVTEIDIPELDMATMPVIPL